MTGSQDELFDLMDLTGKYVFVATEEHYKFGQIIGRVDFETYLVQFQPSDTVPEAGIRSEVYSLEEMTETWATGQKCWNFYDTKEALDRYVEWLETPSEDEGPKVVTLKAKEIN